MRLVAGPKKFTDGSIISAVGATSKAAGSTIFATSIGRTDRPSGFKPKYILGSCMDGYTAIGEIVPEVRKIGATALDIWLKAHGNQQEQLDEMGAEKFAELLKKEDVSLGCITQCKLGPFGL